MARSVLNPAQNEKRMAHMTCRTPLRLRSCGHDFTRSWRESRLEKHEHRLAVEDDHETRSFADVWDGAHRARAALLDGRRSLDGQVVALFASPGARWLEAFVGILLAGGVVLPLSPQYPAVELAWFGQDAQATIVIVSDDLLERADLLCAGRRVVRMGSLRETITYNDEVSPRDADDVALLLYTSGTTGKPKGAMITHANVAVQAELLGEAWNWQTTDLLLHALPLHHLHGLGISLMTSVLSGGATRMFSKFDAGRVWESFASENPPTTYMARAHDVPKIVRSF
jgi:malonyl-CoA/methylmalonyl-CoA synthetase